MNFIFRSYPDHPWFSEWTLEPRNCSASYRANSSARFFQTLETPGHIAANTEAPDWSLQVDIPKGSRTNLLFNGFCTYFERKKQSVGAEVLMPEPGILWGRFDGMSAPVLSSKLNLKLEDGFQWLENDSGVVLIGIRDNRFCLVANSHLLSEAKKTADSYFSKDLEENLTHELEQRQGIIHLLEEMAHHDALAVISAESMMKALRPPEGSIPLSWCQSSAKSIPLMDVNEIHPLALAWRLIDIEVAEELLLCVLKIQTNAGAIPVEFAPHATHSVLEAPKPMLAKTIETVWQVRKDETFLNSALPLLRRHIQWLLNHFDPKRKGVHCWKNSAEAIVPQAYKTDLVTADLSALLISEVDAFNRLQAGSSQPTEPESPAHFQQERNTLEHNLLNQFWNPQENAFVNALLKDNVLALRGFSAFVPLIWQGLPHDHRIHILERIHESGKLPGGLSVLSWRKSAMDDQSFPLLQQLLVFQALNSADPHGQLLNDFSRITLQGFVEWHDLALEKEKRLPINPVMGAYIMNVQAIHQYRYHAKGEVTGLLFRILRRVKADRFDLAVVAATVFAVISVHLVYNVLKAPPPFEMLEAQMNSAYANRDIEGTMHNCQIIMKHYPDDADIAMQLAANISMLSENFEDASRLYEKIREKNPDSPGPMIALGLAYQLQGRFDEAQKNYHEFCYIFEDIFPELVREIIHYRFLLEEGFKAPPKWKEIYRYQLMHEL
ncbi:hypothetical protein P4B35_00475 [Pontiellaceae bacterium B12227]|nr:hypothetical protein [Pontiellaceae bacterium B12227]